MIFAQQLHVLRGLRNIAEYDGISISLIGLSIVFAALILISLFITSLPRVLAMLSPVLPPQREHHAAPRPPAAIRTDEEEAVIVAIGFALHARQTRAK